MRYLLDTCALSELVRPVPNSGVLAWISSQQEDDLFLASVTLGEIQFGIARLPESARRTLLTSWVENDLRTRFRGRVLPVDDAVATQWGNLQGELDRRGQRLPLIDAFVAAVALVHGLTVVTRNDRDFVRGRAPTLNPWT